jgi:excisionase family DNA binding protein
MTMATTMETLTQGWLDAKQAALYVGRTSRTAYKTMLFLARAGKIKAGYDGKTFRFKAEDLDSWLYMNAKRVAR